MNFCDELHGCKKVLFFLSLLFTALAEKTNLQHIEIYLIIQEMGLICLGVGYADENKITCAFEIVRKVTAL